MRSAYLDASTDDGRALFRRRLTAILLTLAIEALLIVLLLTLNPAQFGPVGESNPLKTFSLAADNEGAKPAATPAPEKRAEKPAAAAASKAPPQVNRTKVDNAPPAPVAPIGEIPGLIRLTHEEFVASDISRHGAKSAASAETGPAPGDSIASGNAPNGEPLFNADWYREPTDSQMAYYLPRGLREGAALIACKTAPKYHVEDCQILGEDPPGTGLARGVRNAA
ncbi:MAG: hypothetical protein ACKVOB_00005, partial [Sphingomonas sp.]